MRTATRRVVEPPIALRRLLLALVAGVAVYVLSIAPASAFHIPGATYSGTHSQGGSFELTVSPDGAAVTRISATNISTGPCTLTSLTTTGSIPIINHAFNATLGPGSSVSGSFGAVRQATGTLTVSGPPGSGCGSATVNWNVATTASPAGSEECIAANNAVADANAAVKTRKQAVKRAKKAVRRADTQTEEQAAKKKLKKAKKKLRKAKQQREEALQQQAAVCT